MIPLEVQIVLALVLDLAIGDPVAYPHPVRLMGKLAERLEGPLRRVDASERLCGVVLVLGVLSVSGICAAALLAVCAAVHPLAGDAASIIVLYTTFAAKDLRTHSLRVFRSLQAGDITQARLDVGQMVSRDTRSMDQQEVIRAGVESVAENTVDGVTAPLFFAALAGPVGAIVYKAANTLDSMYGYTSGPFIRFGWASARLDDLLTWLPARITALMAVPAAALCSLSAKDAWRVFLRDRNRHASPNAGQVEAAVAGALQVQLGGGGRYFGQTVHKPVLGDQVQSLNPGHILRVNRLTAIILGLTAAVLLAARAAIV